MNKNDLLFLLWGVYNMAHHEDQTSLNYTTKDFVDKYSSLYDVFQIAITSKGDVEGYADELGTA